MPPVPWSAVLIDDRQREDPEEREHRGEPAAVPGGRRPRGAGRVVGDVAYPMIVPRPTTAIAVTSAKTQLERTLQIRLHSARLVRPRTVAVLIAAAPFATARAALPW